ncbi:type I-F CRISPR-associated helicase Cas3f [Halotalea alkalilenta]|uniref:Type I-F CRISPR-associated helicase Cas3 n=1 Tax=Halotalea alkalilenta TaxID=376489 RepID=A0A172YAI2_9GAMM|nr:type I-F CRISPR-associated helicase Cas3f [Halotalea alkalilenta]ANF56261.1 type I-F CRISPR-associated helicase Cas3 [Halotalea alkalilenta]
MNVLLVSQCSKNALKETRRILDQFAERRGDRTWQTPITQAGLETLRKLLRRRARKNTAVACHWIRGRDHSELLWIVGNTAQFNMKGASPTNTTRRNILRAEDENDWYSGHLIHSLAAMAALFHDLGKASRAFQDRLHGRLEGRNRYRHEWVSLRLLEAFVGDDDDETWLTRLERPTPDDDACWLGRLRSDGVDDVAKEEKTPFIKLPPLAAAIGWLILSHHRLPALPAYDDGGRQKWVGARADMNAANLPMLPEAITAAWNECVETAEMQDVRPYWVFPHGLPVTNDAWRQRSRRLARQLREVRTLAPPLESVYVMHLARLALMLADHHYSSLTGTGRLSGAWSTELYANTAVLNGKRQLCQPLEEHLLGVTRAAGEIVHRLPDMTRALPRIARHKGFRQRSRDPRFRWQDRAFDLAEGLRDKSRGQGFFGINMASTGCGKTIANGRIMYALNDPEEGARFSIALGLRTLTLQTGQVYREKLGLGSDDLAIRVGGGASRALFEHQQRGGGGSESRAALLDEQSHVHFEGQIDEHPLLSRAADDPHARALISAPVLVCTIDHLIPATESLRGGRQIAPMLRLMSSDLVLDEPDDFEIDDLPGLTRLVYWAGLLGSRVLLSSATLPPALVRGLFEAYRAGRTEYQRHRGVPGSPVSPCCAWFDEHGCVQQECAEGGQFDVAHMQFARQRAARLSDQAAVRRGYLVPLSAPSAHPDAVHQAIAQTILAQAFALHAQHHTVDPNSGKRVSFGLVRMANIQPLVAVAQAFYRSDIPEGRHIHLCVYHSQFPLLLRSRLEAQLDRALDRRTENTVFDLPDVRARIDRSSAADQLFIVLGSPVTEVGRDHDYDWAVVEPSSMRSIIQLAGRVRRHRPTPVHAPNIALLGTNVRHLKRTTPAFNRPGFETERDWPLASHQLTELLRAEEIEHIDSRPRLMPDEVLEPTRRLVDLEHARLAALMVEGSDVAAGRPRRKRRGEPVQINFGAYLFYRPQSMTLGALPMQQQPFREDNEPECEFVLLPDESGEDYGFWRVEQDGREEKLTRMETELDRIPEDVFRHPRIAPWNEPDYMAAVVDQAEAMDMTIERCAQRFGRIRLKTNYAPQGWHFHPALGFVRRK